MKHPLLIGVIIMALIALQGMQSCSNKHREIDKVAVRYIMMLEKSEYNAVVENTVGCKEASQAYRNHMTDLYKQMMDDMHEKHGHIKQAICKSHDLSEDGSYADAYLQLTFEDNSTENILLSLELHDGLWLLK